MKRWHFNVAAVLASIAILIVWFVIANSKPSVEISKVDYSPMTLHFRTWNINGFLGITVYSKTTNECLWCASIENFQPINKITYGILPPGSKQVLPQDGKLPRALKDGEELYVKVTYQFDRFMAPSFATTVWYVGLEKDTGRVVGNVSTDVLPPLPPIKE